MRKTQIKNKKRAKEPTPKKAKALAKYVSELARGAKHNEAELVSGVTFTDVSRERARSESFRVKYNAAIADREAIWMAQRYEKAHHRATVGVERSVTCGSGICGTDTIPSDRLMEVLLRKDHPEWFENRVKAEHNVAPPLVELLMHLEQTIPQGSGSAKKSEG